MKKIAVLLCSFVVLLAGCMRNSVNRFNINLETGTFVSEEHVSGLENSVTITKSIVKIQKITKDEYDLANNKNVIIDYSKEDENFFSFSLSLETTIHELAKYDLVFEGKKKDREWNAYMFTFEDTSTIYPDKRLDMVFSAGWNSDNVFEEYVITLRNNINVQDNICMTLTKSEENLIAE